MKCIYVFGCALFLVSFQAQMASAERCNVGKQSKRILCLERKIDNLQNAFDMLLNGQQAVYIQNELPDRAPAFCVQNDFAGGTSFVDCNIPERGQKLKIIKWPQE